MKLIKKKLLFFTLLTPSLLNAHSGPVDKLGRIEELDSTSLGNEAVHLVFESNRTEASFFENNQCAKPVNKGVLDENEVVVDLSGCDSVDIPPDVEILAAGNVWGGGQRL